jgi:hypothetical protein
MASHEMRTARIPRYGRALMKMLDFSGDDCHELQQLNSDEWGALLQLCDKAQLTLLFRHKARRFVPKWVETRLDKNHLGNAARFERVQEAVAEIERCFLSQSIDFVLLKGFANSHYFIPDPKLRAQGDIDIWCLPESVDRARDALLQIGYRPFGKSTSRHLDPMIRETSWEWHGDYFAPDLPIPVDLHYQLWDQEREGIPGLIEKELWQRRANGVLDLADTLAFAAIHTLMHLLHGDLRLMRAWEIASFLHQSSRNDEFWERWRSLYSADARKVQIIVFVLCGKWFGCSVAALINEEATALPSDIKLWIERYGISPVEALFAPNKNELWLNLCLVRRLSDKISVLFRRLFPIHAAALKDATAERQPKFWLRRAAHHMWTLPLTCLHGLAWGCVLIYGSARRRLAVRLLL